MTRKRIISFLMAFAMLFSLVSPAIALADGGFNTTTIAVFYEDYDNYDQNGNRGIYVHYWQNNGDQGKWPGKEMTYLFEKDGHSVYGALIPDNADRIIYNNYDNSESTTYWISASDNGRWDYGRDGYWRNVYHAEVAATCTTAGNVPYYELDGHKYDVNLESIESEVVSALGHNMTHYNAVAHTCTEDGTVEYWSCSRCNKNFGDAQGTTELASIIDPAAHNPWRDPNVIPNENYTSATIVFTCNSCENATATIENVPLTLTESNLVTCAQEGGNYYSWSCTVWGVERNGSIYRSLPSADVSHTLQEHPAQAATCNATGNNKYYECTVCGLFFSDAAGTQRIDENSWVIPVDNNAHFWGSGVVTDPTCTEQGYKTYTCSVCGASFNTDYTNALGHNWGEGDVTTPPTCTGEGVRTYTCSRCGATKTEAISATGHTWGAVRYSWAGDGTTCTAIRDCANCNAQQFIEAQITYEVTLEPTCTAPGNKLATATFPAGGAFETTTQTMNVGIGELGHNLTAHPAVAATFDAAGNTAYWECTRCGKYFSDEEGETEAVLNSWVVPQLVAVAQIGETKYETLKAAFDAVTDGDTIKLLGDVTQDLGFLFNQSGVSAKLNLNNFTITVNNGSNVNNRAIKIQAGTLEVYGGSIVAVGSGTTSSNGSGCYGAFRVEADGKLIAHDLTLSNARPWGLNVKVLGGEAELTNVTINSSYGGGIEVTEADLGTGSKAGKATLTNCTFAQSNYFDHCSSAVTVSGGSELIVNSGTYTGEVALYVFSSGGVITVNGGTFTGSRKAFVAAIDTVSYPQYTGGFEIKGGTFNGVFDITSPAFMAISGGTFDNDPSAYLAEGYDATAANGVWTVAAHVPEIDKPTDTSAQLTATIDDGVFTVDAAAPVEIAGQAATVTFNVAAARALASEGALTLTVEDQTPANAEYKTFEITLTNNNGTPVFTDGATGAKATVEVPVNFANGTLVAFYRVVNNAETLVGTATVADGKATVELSHFSTYTVRGVTSYDVWVGGERINNANASDVFGDGTVSYDAATNTLTLNGYSYSGAGYVNSAVYATGDLNIVVTGTNSLISSAANGFGVYTGGSLVITGSGTTPTLNVTAASTGYAIKAAGASASLTGLKMTLTGNRGLVVNENQTSDTIEIDNCDITFAPGTKRAIQVYNDTGDGIVRIVNGSNLRGAGEIQVYAYGTTGGDAILTIDSSTVNLTGNTETSRHGIELLSNYGDAVLTIQNNSNVTVTTSNDTDAVNVGSQHELNGKGKCAVSITDSTVVLNGERCGLTAFSWCETDNVQGTTVEIVDSTVDISGGTYYGLYAYAYDSGDAAITITDSTVSASAPLMGVEMAIDTRYYDIHGNLSYTQTDSIVTLSGGYYGLDIDSSSKTPAEGDGIATVVISGGSLTSSGAFYVTGDEEGSITMSGTTVSIDTTAGIDTYPIATDILNIDSGDYTITTPVSSELGIYAGTGNISGGTFNIPIDEDLCAENYIPVATTEGGVTTYGVKSGSYVAQIGDDKYETLAAAIAAVKTAASATRTTVSLLADTDEVPVIDFTYPIQISGNGHKLGLGGASGGYAMRITATGADVIVDNTIVGSMSIGRGINVNAGNVKLVVQNNSEVYGDHYPINVYANQTGVNVNNNNITITDSTISGYCAINLWGSNGTVTVTGSTLEGLNPYTGNSNDFGVIAFEYDSTNYTVEVTSSTINARSTNVSPKEEYIVLSNDGSSGNTVIFTNCLIDREGDATMHPMICEDGGIGDSSLTVSLKGTTDKATGTAPVLPEGYKYLAVDANGYQSTAVINYVAEITGGAKYETLAEAIAAVPTDDTKTTITMLANSAETGVITVAAGKNVELDLNDKTVSYTTTVSNASTYFITNKGTLTIKDSGTNGRILLTAPNVGYGSYETVTVYNLGGTLNLTDGIIQNAAPGGLAYAVNNSSNAWADPVVSTFNMTGGVLRGANTDATLRVYQNTSKTQTSTNIVDISGGTIENGIFVDTFIYEPTAVYTGDNIHTTITISGNADVDGLIDLKMRHPFNTTLYITGGDFDDAKLQVRKKTEEWNANVAEPTTPYVYISGGDFDFSDPTKTFLMAYDSNTSSWTTYEQAYAVSGGTFDAPVPGEFCAENYIPVDNGNGTYGVTPVTYVARVDGQGYETFAAALAAANTNGGTLTLLADVALTSQQNITHSMTIDLNGHNITAANCRALHVQSGEVLITGTGTITSTHTEGNSWSKDSSVIRVGNSGADKAKLTIGANVTVSAPYSYGVTVFGTNTAGVELVVNGTVAATGLNGAISGNGNSGNKGAVTINAGATISSTVDAAIYHPQDDTLTINGGTITGPAAVYVKSGTVAISGGTLTATAAAAAYSYNGDGCNATGDALVVDNCNYPGGAPEVTISGAPSFVVTDNNADGIGSYTGNGEDQLAEVTANSDQIAIDDNQKWVEGETAGTYILVAKEYVAEIVGGAKYETLAEAVAAAQNGDTITLLDNIELSSYIAVTNVTIDLAGHNVTASGNNGIFDCYGTVTIKDTAAANAKGTITGKWGIWANSGANVTLDGANINATLMGVKVDAGATATLTSGTVTGATYGVVAYGTVTVGGAAIVANGEDATGMYVGESGSATLNSGSITSNKWGVTVFDAATLTVNGGSITSTNDAAISTNGNAGQAATIVINSGTITSQNEIAIYQPSGTVTIGLSTCDGTDSHSHPEITGKTAVYVKSGTLNIYCGTLTATGAAAEYDYNGNGANPTGDALVVDNCNYPGGAPTVTISGGTFTGGTGAKGIGSYSSAGTGANATDPGLATVTATGNTITIPADEKWVAQGTDPETYLLVEKVYVAQVGETKYEVFADAYAAASDVDALVLLKDITLSSTLTVDKPLTLDLNGHTISFNRATLKISSEDVVITDTSENKNGIVRTTYVSSTSYYAVEVLTGGSLTIDAGTIDGRAALKVNKGSNATVTGTASVTATSFGIFLAGDYSNVNNKAVLTVSGTASVSATNSDGVGIRAQNASDITVGSNASVYGNKYGIQCGLSKLNVAEGTVTTSSTGTAIYYAATTETATGVWYSEYYSNILKVVENNGTITLYDDQSGQSINNGKTFTVDLNNHSLTTEFSVKWGFVTFENGTIEGTVEVYGSSDSSLDAGEYNHLVIADTVAMTNGDYSIVLYNHNYSGEGNSYGSLIDVYGTTTNIWVIGNLHGGNCTINIKDDATVNDVELGIGLMGYATVNVESGATVTGGETGIEVRAGVLNVKAGATVIGSGDTTTVTPKDSGNTTKGAGIAIAQHCTELPITVNIEGGTITGHTALNIANPQNNDDTEKAIAINISGTPRFNGDAGETVITDDRANLTISGGTFDMPVREEDCAEGYIPCTYNTDPVTYGVKAGTFVARNMTTGVGYETLAEAVAAAADGNTIKLLADSTGAGLFVGPNKFTTTGLTIDFNDKTYTVETPVGSSNTVNQMLHFEQGNKITLTNGTINVTDDGTKLPAFNMVMQNYCTLIIDDMTIDGTGIAVATYAASYGELWGGSAKPQFNYNKAGSSVIRNSTITVTGDLGIDDAAGLTIEDDAVINANKIVTKGTDARFGSATPTISVENRAKFKLTDATGAAAFDALLAANSQSLGTPVNGVYTVETLKVAQIGETKYETLAAAIAAVPADGTETTITMIANETFNDNLGVTIPQGRSIILDLNGHELRQYAPNASVSHLIENLGTLTIKDSTDTDKNGNGTGKMYSEAAHPSSAYNYATNLISNHGNLTIESGYFESHTNYASYVVDNYPGGTLTVTGGHLYNYFTSAIRLFCNSTTLDNVVNVKGGVIDGYCAIWMQSPNNNNNNGTLNISGGTINTTEKAVVEGTKEIYNGSSYLYAYPSSANMSMNISGGTLNTNVCTWGDLSESITGGTFNGRVYAANATHFISGGDFVKKPTAVYIDEDKAASSYIYDSATNTYRYTIDDAVAQIDDIGYLTLADALADAADGDTITLLADSTGAGLFIGPNKFTATGLTIDFAGFTYTVETPVGSTGTENQALHFDEGNNITLKSSAQTKGTINVTQESEELAAFQMFMQNYGTLTVENMNLDGTGIAVATYGSSYAAPWGGSAKPQFNYNTAGSSVIRNSTVTMPGALGVDDSATLLIEEDAVINVSAIATKGTDARYTGTSVVNAENGAQFKLTGTDAVATFETYLAAKGQSLGTPDANGVYTVETLKVAQIGDVKYATLAAAIAAAQNGDTITMLQDVELSEGLDVSRTVTLDLNGCTIANANGITTDYLIAVLHGGTLTVEDTLGGGKISMGTDYCAIKMTKANDGDSTQNATLIVNSGTIEGFDFAISGNGNEGRGNSVITINGGVIRNTKQNGTGDDAAIYQPNTGTVTLNGGTITGLTGVEIRSGNLVIPANSTVVITGTGDPASATQNGNGTTTFGAGIAIAQHTTDHAIDVTIAGGTVSGAYALAVVNPNGRTGDNVQVEVTGGTFIGTGTNKVALNVTDARVDHFISGGSFSEQVPSNLCAAGYMPVTEADENNMYTVTKGGLKLSASLTLNDNINVNLFLRDLATGTTIGDYTVIATFDGKTQTIPGSAATDVGGGKYKFTVAEVYSYQMWMPVTITILASGQPIITFDYSVETFFTTAYNNPNNAEAYRDVCKAGLDYGAAAQLYFDGKTYNGGVYEANSGNLVNESTNPGNTFSATQPSGYAASVNVNTLGGISRLSASLILGSEVSIKVYFKYAGDINTLTFSAARQDDSNKTKTVTGPVSEGGGVYSVKITGIKSYELWRYFTLTVTNGSGTFSFNYSPYLYAQMNWDSSDAELAKLVQALVAYGDKAKAMWPND